MKVQIYPTFKHFPNIVWRKYVTWSQKLEEIRYFKKGEKNNSVYKISTELPKKSILKNGKVLEKNIEEVSSVDNCIVPTFTSIRKDIVKDKNILNKKELRKLKRRERNKAKG
ncbi:Hypothetical protein SRAE_1000163300 [Strongyloides ratti]|uniref:Uncharacterized protein n=1 Tax=Strongyloides ratti TaxID=34506 RepID=A0A090L111_STRRB|nr:Hypothetical protein SRAE_1000163300 [Strongyloides ratti]CEF63371.1 Hypothetical protein SRAE_1000163300 [Strongyloides ratti]